MSEDDFPAPRTGFVLTHFLVVSDQDRSREFYQSVFGATVVRERDPVILRLANSWLILNVGGGPTDDKPTVTLTTPADPDRTSAFLNIRVADIAAAYADWSARGAEFLTEPKDHGRENPGLHPGSRWAPDRGGPGDRPAEPVIARPVSPDTPTSPRARGVSADTGDMRCKRRRPMGAVGASPGARCPSGLWLARYER